jgi:hypothetical protein
VGCRNGENVAEELEDEAECGTMQFVNYVFDLEGAVNSYKHNIEEFKIRFENRKGYEDIQLNEISFKVAFDKYKADKIMQKCESLRDLLDTSEAEARDAVHNFKVKQKEFYDATENELELTILFLGDMYEKKEITRRKIMVPSEYKLEELETAFKKEVVASTG